MKPRYWDERHDHPPGVLFDHTYETIKSLAQLGIYEMRLDDPIGGCNNIRVVFFDPPKDWQPLTPVNFEGRPLRTIWVLEVLQKKRDEWTENDISRFRASRLVLKLRFYR